MPRNGIRRRPTASRVSLPALLLRAGRGYVKGDVRWNQERQQLHPGTQGKLAGAGLPSRRHPRYGSGAPLNRDRRRRGGVGNTRCAGSSSTWRRSLPPTVPGIPPPHRHRADLPTSAALQLLTWFAGPRSWGCTSVVPDGRDGRHAAERAYGSHCCSAVFERDRGGYDIAPSVHQFDPELLVGFGNEFK
jgi:hypothetical protein